MKDWLIDFGFFAVPAVFQPSSGGCCYQNIASFEILKFPWWPHEPTLLRNPEKRSFVCQGVAILDTGHHLTWRMPIMKRGCLYSMTPKLICFQEKDLHPSNLTTSWESVKFNTTQSPLVPLSCTTHICKGALSPIDRERKRSLLWIICPDSFRPQLLQKKVLVNNQLYNEKNWRSLWWLITPG